MVDGCRIKMLVHHSITFDNNDDRSVSISKLPDMSEFEPIYSNLEDKMSCCVHVDEFRHTIPSVARMSE